MSFLKKIRKGKIKRPHFILIYGTPSIGKTTFASKAPKPIFIDVDDGSSEVDVDALTPKQIQSYEDFEKALDDLESSDYKTLVIDSVTKLEPMMISYVCKLNGKAESLNSGKLAYGQGAVKMREMWGFFVDRLRRFRDTTGMNIVLVGHSTVKPFNDPLQDSPYDRYQIQLQKEGMEVLTQAVETILFAKEEVYVRETKNKYKAYGDGDRIIHTQRRPAYDAKNRFNLPEELPLDWSAFDKACKNKDVDVLTRCNELVEKVKDEKTKENAKEAIKKAEKNPKKLLQILNQLEEIV